MSKRKVTTRSNLKSIAPHDYDGYISYLSDLLIQRSIQLHERPIGDDLFSLVGIEIDKKADTLLDLVLIDNPEFEGLKKEDNIPIEVTVDLERYTDVDLIEKLDEPKEIEVKELNQDGYIYETFSLWQALDLFKKYKPIGKVETIDGRFILDARRK